MTILRSKLQTLRRPGLSSVDYVPYTSLITPEVLWMRAQRAYVSTWHLNGVCVETAEPAHVLQRKAALVQFLKSLGGGDYSLWVHRLRHRTEPHLNARFASAFCQSLHDDYLEGLKDRFQRSNALYLSIVYCPSRHAGFRLPNLSFADQRAHALSTMSALHDQVSASLQAYGPRRLGLDTSHGRPQSELLTFLAQLLNGVPEPIGLPFADISVCLPSSRLHFGRYSSDVEIWHPREHRFAGLLDIQDFPRQSEPGLLNPLLYVDYDFVETQSFSMLNRRDALGALTRQKGRLIATEDAAVDEVVQIDQAMNALQSGQLELGEYHYSLCVFADQPEGVARQLADARAKLQDHAGLRLSPIDLVPDCAWFSQLPGNWRMRPRSALITSRNFADLAGFHNFTTGKSEGNPWGEAVAVFNTPSGHPYYFNFHDSPPEQNSEGEAYPGNTFICGATGVGKTALQSVLLAFSTKYAGLRAVVFDKDRGSEIFIRAMGGRYFQLVRGEPSGFNPFQMPPSDANLRFCEHLLLRLIAGGEGNPNLPASDEAAIAHAVRAVMNESIAPQLRCLSLVAQNLPRSGTDSLFERLRKWLRGQRLGWVFDNPLDLHDPASVQISGFDYTDILDDPEIRTPVMAYLLHRTEEMIDGRPFIYVMEEFWKPLRDPYFADFALNKQKTIRKQGGLGVFVTQSPSDVLAHPIGKTMVEQSVTQIFLPNPRADAEDYVEGFKLTPTEFRILKSFGELSRQCLIRQGQTSRVVAYDLSMLGEKLDVLSGNTRSVEWLDAIRGQLGDDPDAWLPAFCEAVAARKRTGKA
ncbi:VirB4 family type IV secretion/conjugal transfer ATPase [Asticcacaulis sp. DXS10W]|uniref:VirB4 family type IV secretion/conjugal transfer ATPase n=1 Tax=Asticcacaulis currens TaxID=2984210 RepID=A0ABT5I9V2_9CAUL|nr:VirB4 family type IV secretion/conjugal transfer ATPase [Asticcacaulis currens]MDC7692802.1 VirB4 family type IV secretion/conjugal transfer ATPase [Asticcacaulis currens]